MQKANGRPPGTPARAIGSNPAGKPCPEREEITMLHRRLPGLSGLTLLVLLALAAFPATATTDERLVTASGEGRIEVAPDIAWLSFGISSRQPTVAAARDEVAQGVARLIKLARDSGLKDEHIATAALSVSPDYEWMPDSRERVLRGYIVSRQVSLRLTDLAKLGELTEKALGVGVTDASPAVFDTSRRAELETEALVAAARDARARAQVMAGALGGRVGHPVRIEAAGPVVVPRPMAMRAVAADAEGMSGAETYQPGLIRVTAGVIAAFELLVP
jgi:uncharacterized protein